MESIATIDDNTSLIMQSTSMKLGSLSRPNSFSSAQTTIYTYIIAWTKTTILRLKLKDVISILIQISKGKSTLQNMDRELIFTFLSTTGK